MEKYFWASGHRVSSNSDCSNNGRFTYSVVPGEFVSALSFI